MRSNARKKEVEKTLLLWFDPLVPRLGDNMAENPLLRRLEAVTAAGSKAEALDELEALAETCNEISYYMIHQHILTPPPAFREEQLSYGYHLLWDLPPRPILEKIFVPGYLIAIFIFGFMGCFIINYPVWGILGLVGLACTIILWITEKAQAEAEYKKVKKARETEIVDALKVYQEALSGNMGVAEEVLKQAVERQIDIEGCSAEISLSSDGKTVMLDIDLPEIEGIPDSISIVRRGRMTIEEKPKKESEVVRDYAIQVHGILLRLAGTCFAVLPQVRTILASGYTQRIDPATGNERNEYILSAIFDEERWCGLNLVRADPIAVFETFPHQRKILRGGKLAMIEPFAAVDLTKKSDLIYS